MHKFRLVPAGGAALMLASLLAFSPVILSQPAVPTPVLPLASSELQGPTGSSPAAPTFAEFSSGAQNSRSEVALSGVSNRPLMGLVLASNEPDMSPMFAPLLALYSQLLAISGQPVDGIGWTRLKARLDNAALADKTSLLSIDDVLAANLESLEILAVSAQQAKDIGLGSAAFQGLPKYSELLARVKSAMLELPQGLEQFSGPVAIAVWGGQTSAPELVSVLVRAD